MRAPRRVRVRSWLLLPLLAACARTRGLTGNQLIEQAELREDWYATVVPFAVVAALVLVLVVVRQRRKPTTLFDGLFTVRQVPDVKRWRRERAARREAERVADREAYLAREKLAAATVPAPAPAASVPVRVEMGPPTISFLGRFAAALVANVGLTVLASLFLATVFGLGDSSLVWLAVGFLWLIPMTIASLICAFLLSTSTDHGVLFSIGAGAASTVVVLVVILGISVKLGLFAAGLALFYLGGGAIMGLAVGVAEHASRRPIGDASPSAGGASQQIEHAR